MTKLLRQDGSPIIWAVTLASFLLFPLYRIYFAPNLRNQEQIQPEAARVGLSLGEEV